jgi:hypothetical protein
MKLAIVVPCFNEAAVLADTARALTGQLDALADAGAIDRARRI